MEEFKDLRNNFDALYLQLNGELNLGQYQQKLLDELHISFSDYERHLSGQPELEDMLRERDIEILRLHKIISKGVEKYLKNS